MKYWKNISDIPSEQSKHVLKTNKDDFFPISKLTAAFNQLKYIGCKIIFLTVEFQ